MSELTPCAFCRRHVRPEEEVCPFCGARLRGKEGEPVDEATPPPGTSNRKRDPITVYGLPPLLDEAPPEVPRPPAPVYGAPPRPGPPRPEPPRPPAPVYGAPPRLYAPPEPPQPRKKRWWWPF